MRKKSQPKAASSFRVYETEPIMRLITSFSFMTPVRLGIVFFFMISLTLAGWGAVAQSRIGNSAHYITYFENISWSVSLLYLFPFIVGLTLKFYEEIPRLFDYLLEERVEATNDALIEAFRTWLNKRFNGCIHPLVLFVVTLGLNWLYFKQVLASEPSSWMVGGTVLQGALMFRQGLTPLGFYAALVQIVLIYWALILIWKTVIFSWGLHELFNKQGFAIRVDPLHPDGCCGLRRVSSTTMFLNYILLLFGLYVSLKVIDKIIVQKAHLFADIGNPMMLGGYAILAPLLFFYPLGAPHYRMKEEKERFLAQISGKSRRLLAKLVAADSAEDCAEAAQVFQQLEQTRRQLMTSIPVWPFNFRSIEAFLGIVVVPLLPTVISLVFDYLFKQ